MSNTESTGKGPASASAGQNRVRSMRTRRLLPILLVGQLLLAACGGGSTSEESSAGASDNELAGTPGTSDAATDVSDIRVAHSTGSVQPHRINGYAAPIDFGSDFGIELQESNVELFDSHATALQVLLSGKLDILGSSLVSALQVREKGQDIKVFCPYTNGIPLEIVGTGDVTSLEDLKDPGVRVAVESPGGPTNFAMDLVFAAKDLDMTVNQLGNTVILEDSPLRLGALASGDADVAVLVKHQLPSLEEQLGEENVHVLSDVVRDTENKAVILVFTAKADWLENNMDTATAFCASVLNANRQLAQDFDLFAAEAEKYMDPAPDEEVLRPTWELLGTAELFPFNGLTEEALTFSQDVLVDTGLLEEALPYDEIVDQRPMEGALELLGGPVDRSEVMEDAD